jgi:hypothetical protein
VLFFNQGDSVPAGRACGGKPTERHRRCPECEGEEPEGSSQAAEVGGILNRGAIGGG